MEFYPICLIDRISEWAWPRPLPSSLAKGTSDAIGQIKAQDKTLRTELCSESHQARGIFALLLLACPGPASVGSLPSKDLYFQRTFLKHQILKRNARLTPCPMFSSDQAGWRGGDHENMVERSPWQEPRWGKQTHRRLWKQPSQVDSGRSRSSD